MTNQLHPDIQFDNDEVVLFHTKGQKQNASSTIKGMLSLTLLWNLLSWIMLLTITVHNNTLDNVSPQKYALQQLQPWKGHPINGGFYFLLLCVIIGIWLVGHTIRMYKMNGPIFIGTNTRLLIITSQETTSYHWSMFQSSPLIKKDCIRLKLVTGKFESRDNGSDVFQNKELELVDIEQMDSIFQICLERINKYCIFQR